MRNKYEKGEIGLELMAVELTTLFKSLEDRKKAELSGQGKVDVDFILKSGIATFFRLDKI